MTTNTTMLEGWPDALRCGSGSSSGAIFMVSNISTESSSYSQVFSQEYRYVTFNKNGTYWDRGGDDDSSAGCQNKSIKQLYDESRAFNFVTSRLQDDSGITSIKASWPDALRCGNNADETVFMPHGISSNEPGASETWYSQVYSPQYRFVVFNRDGTYNRTGGDDDSSASCQNKSIKQLYSEERAFNLVTSKTQDSLGVTSMVPNWPDALRCGASSSGSIFVVHGGTRYSQVYSDDYRYVLFNADGTYWDRGGDDGSSAGCQNKSIEQLYDEGRAFNFVTSRSPDSPTMSPTNSPTESPTISPIPSPTTSPSLAPTASHHTAWWIYMLEIGLPILGLGIVAAGAYGCYKKFCYDSSPPPYPVGAALLAEGVQGLAVGGQTNNSESYSYDLYDAVENQDQEHFSELRNPEEVATTLPLID